MLATTTPTPRARPAPIPPWDRSGRSQQARSWCTRRPAPELEVSEYVDREINEIIYRAERSFVALWDTSLQSGVLIDWTP